MMKTLLILLALFAGGCAAVHEEACLTAAADGRLRVGNLTAFDEDAMKSCLRERGCEFVADGRGRFTLRDSLSYRVGCE